MKTTPKKLFSLLLALVMVVCVLPASILADEPEDTPQDEPKWNTAITVPRDAKLFVGSKTNHFVAFTEVKPVDSVDNDDGTSIYYYDLSYDQKKGTTYNYRVSGEGYITYAGKFIKNAEDYELSVTAEQLKPDGKTKTTIDRDVTANSNYNVADIYLNINPEGWLRLDEGDSYQLVNLRSWEAVDGLTANYFIEPDYHYTVLDENGSVSGSVVSVSDAGVVTAKGKGTAIVLVTYDAFQYADAAGGPFFGAIWPENTGVFVVSVGASEGGITTGMTLNKGKNSADSKLSGDALDAEHDVIYFTGDSGSYTFTPETQGCAVSVAAPSVSESAMSFSGFQTVPANTDGSVTVPLAQGRNIVKLTKDGKSAYQVITAKKLTVTAPESVVPGGGVSVKFDTIYHPANKLAGVYNMSAVAVYTDVDGYEGKLVGGMSAQYNFAANENAQTVGKILSRSAGAWGSVNYTVGAQITVPEDWAEESFTLSGGSLIAVGLGDPYGNHRGITLEEGKAPNFNAAVKEAYLGQLPDITIPVTLSRSVTSLTVTTQPTKTEYLEDDSFDPAGMVVHAAYSDGSEGDVSSYTVEPQVLAAGTTAVTVSYGGKSVEVPVTVTAPAVTGIAVTTPPAKTSYTAGEVLNPTGMVVTATYENGKSAVVEDYSLEPGRALLETDEQITVRLGEFSATTPITVTAAPAPGPDAPADISVKFTLLGDEAHGEPEGDGDTHTMKGGNLTTWIPETEITVSADAKVIDVIARALGLAGIPYENPEGNYISSVRGLREQSNGSLSGWMYTLNGAYPEKGVAEQSVKNGDRIVFHYTDDYTTERASGQWSGSTGGGSNTGNKEETTVTTTLTPGATANDKGEASVAITGDTLDGTVAQAKTEGADVIVIAPEVKGDASKVGVELPKSGVDNIAKQTNADLKVETDIADITIPQESLEDLTGQSGSKVTISAGAVKDTDEVKLEISVDGRPVEKLTGGIAVSVPAKDGNSGNVLVIVNSDGSETVVKKSTVDGKTVAALLDGSCTVKVVDNSKQFSDTADHWSKDAVAFASAHELFSGTGENTFSPDASMSRAMLATVLYRLEDAAVSGSNTFPDVAEGTWYTDAVTWASNAGIVTGTGSGFDPNGNVTREQLATMLYRYARTLGMSTGESGDLSRFSDGGKTSDWARDAMEWAVGSGLISGKGDGILDPTGSATRAEVAVIMQRLIGLMMK